MREKVQFETNVPVTLSFAFREPLKVEGRYGDQYMFRTSDDRVAYLPPVVADRIKQLGVDRDEEVVICKAEVKTGARRAIQWQVAKAAGSQVDQQPPESAPAASEVAATPQTNTHPPVRTVLEACLIDAMSAAAGAERWAKEHDCGVRFTSEDIRALGISLYIQRERQHGGGRP